jgi:hypothetical protein
MQHDGLKASKTLTFLNIKSYMPPKAEPKKGAKAGEVEPAVDVPKAMKDLKPRWEKLSATVGVPLENKVYPRQ